MNCVILRKHLTNKSMLIHFINMTAVEAVDRFFLIVDRWLENDRGAIARRLRRVDFSKSHLNIGYLAGYHPNCP